MLSLELPCALMSRGILNDIEFSKHNRIQALIVKRLIFYIIKMKKKMSIKFELKTISIRIGLLVITSYDITAYFKYSHSKPPMLKYVENITLKLSCVADYFDLFSNHFLDKMLFLI